MTLPSGLLAYCVMKTANLSNEKRQLPRLTTTKLTFQYEKTVEINSRQLCNCCMRFVRNKVRGNLFCRSERRISII